jgi:ElaB/YqjD/DUF883 family membrane-anchored ribosome-binding protein
MRTKRQEHEMNDASAALKDSQARLAKEIRSLVDDADALLRHAVRDAGEGYDDARTRLERSLKTARAELQGIDHSLREGARQAGRATDEFVHEHPWQVIGIGAGVGLLLGLLIARR